MYVGAGFGAVTALAWPWQEPVVREVTTSDWYDLGIPMAVRRYTR